MDPGKWLYVSYPLSIDTKKLTTVTAVERVSHYNGVAFLPDGKKLLMTSLIDGVSKPFMMDLDGTNKRDISGGENGFTYGLNASPDGKLVCYHEGYQVFISNSDGPSKQRIVTGNPFNFAPSWSADGRWLLFVSGVRGRSNPYVVRRGHVALPPTTVPRRPVGPLQCKARWSAATVRHASGRSLRATDHRSESRPRRDVARWQPRP